MTVILRNKEKCLNATLDYILKQIVDIKLVTLALNLVIESTYILYLIMIILGLLSLVSSASTFTFLTKVAPKGVYLGYQFFLYFLLGNSLPF